MLKQRYEISDADWELIADIFNSPRLVGRPQADDRPILNGMIGVLFSDAI